LGRCRHFQSRLRDKKEEQEGNLLAQVMVFNHHIINWLYLLKMKSASFFIQKELK